MAIEQYQLKSGEKRFRSIWINPLTGKKESKTFSDQLDAQEYDIAIKRRIKSDPASFGNSPEEAGLTFIELASSYLQSSRMTNSSKAHALIVLKTSILPIIGSIKCDDLTKKDMNSVKLFCMKNGNKQNTINRKISIIKAILNWGVDEGFIESNTVGSYVCKRGPDEQIKPPTTEERDKIWAESAPHLKRVIIIATGLGLRVGSSELLDLKWSDVDFTENTITVRSAKKNKTKQLREIELNESVVSFFRKWYKEDVDLGMKHIIHYKGKKVSKIRTAWNAAKRRAGIDRRIRPYDMRHYFVTEAIKAGADLKAVAEIVGHSDMSMILKYYQHTVAEQKRFAVNAITLPTDNSHGNSHGNIG